MVGECFKVRSPAANAVANFAGRCRLLVWIAEWVPVDRYCVDGCTIDTAWLAYECQEVLALAKTDLEEARQRAARAMSMTLSPSVAALVQEELPDRERELRQLMGIYPSRVVSHVWHELAEWNPQKDLPKVRGLLRLWLVLHCTQILRRNAVRIAFGEEPVGNVLAAEG